MKCIILAHNMLSAIIHVIIEMTHDFFPQIHTYTVQFTVTIYM